MNCKNCLANCGSKGNDHETDCSGYLPMTNADKIRAMTDEKLAIVLLLTAQGGAIIQRGKEDWLKWLKEEVKDETNNFKS